MARVARETLVRAPPERVFHVLTDPLERRRWLTTFREDLLEKRLAPGMRIRARRNDARSHSQYEIVIERMDAPRVLETTIVRNGEPAARGGFDVSAASEGARVRAWAEFELHGLQRMMTTLVALNTEKGLEADLASLKRHVEALRAP